MHKGFMEAPTNADDWETFLGIVGADLYNRTIEPKVAKEIHNGAGKAVGWVRARLENAHQRGEKPEIAMLAKKK